MPNPLKYIVHGGLYLVTSRTEEGLPFKDVGRYRPIFESIVARGQALYPVLIHGYILMANHFHFLLTPADPEQFPLFVGYVKQELAHAVNRIKGRKQRTVWCEGYDSPVLLGFEEALYYHMYLYTQPQSAHLNTCIDDYKGASSWEMFKGSNHSKECPRRLRTAPDEIDTESPSHTLTVSPYSWLQGLKSDMSPEEFKELLMHKVREREGSLSEERKKKAISVQKSSETNSDTYVPQKRSKRMYCICWNIKYRKTFLGFIKNMVYRCREVFLQWKAGLYDVIWPPGFFPPSARRRANLLSA